MSQRTYHPSYRRQNRSLFICIREHGRDQDLPLDDTELEELFKKHPIQEARILKDKTRQSCQTFGKVTFKNIEDAIYAVKVHQGDRLHGKPLLVRYWRESDTPVESKPVPPVASGPVASKPVTSKSMPHVAKPVLHVTSKSVPPVVSKPVPSVTSKSVPPVVSKPVPSVTSKSAPPVSKTVPSVTSKLVPSVTSKSVPPVVSKSVPEPVPPVASKPLGSVLVAPPGSRNVKNTKSNHREDDFERNSRTLFVLIGTSNVEGISDSILKAHFQGFQKVIQDAFIVCDPKTKQQKNFGFVIFVSREDAAAALKKFQGTKLNDQYELTINFSRTRLQCSPEIMTYLVHISKSDYRTFNKLKRGCFPAKVIMQNDVIYLSENDSNEIERATASILNDPVVKGLLIDVIQVKANPALIRKKISHIKCAEVKYIILHENDDKCNILLFSRDLAKFQTAQKLLKSFRFQLKGYPQIEVDSNWLSSALNCVDSLPVTLKVCSDQTPQLHGLCIEDIEEAWNRIVPAEEAVDITAVTVSYCTNEIQREAAKRSCRITIPPDCELLPLKKLVTITISGCNMKAKETLDRIKLISDDATISVCQSIHNVSYLPLCSRDEVLKCRENLKKKLCVISSFSSDKSSDDVAEQAYLCVKRDHVVAIQIVVGALTTVKADAIVIPTGEATTQHMYPIELPHLRKSYSKHLYNDACELSKVMSLVSEKLSMMIFHTLFPISEQRSANLHDLVTATLEHSIQEKVGSVSYPGIDTQMIKSLIDVLVALSPTTLHTVNVVVGSQDEAKAYVKTLKAFISGNKLHIWSWENDYGSFTQYAQNDELNDAYRSNPTGVCCLNIGDGRYKIDFQTMKQTNLSTKNQRKVKKKPVGDSGKKVAVEWQYMGDDQTFCSYTPKMSSMIEEKFQQDHSITRLSIQSRSYRLDFKNMVQINEETGYKRDVQRKSNTFFLCDDEIVINLKGMQKNLDAARDCLEECLKGLLCSKDVPLPERAGPSFQRKLITVARKHKIGCEVKEGTDSEASSTNRRILRIEGLEDLVKEAKVDMQDMIIEFQTSSNQLSKATPENYPPEWEGQPETEQFKLFTVTDSTEYNKISKRVKKSLPNAQITYLQRVQNKWLWNRYLQEKTRLHEKNSGKVHELELFHGSRNTQAETICASEEGFDMRHSDKGMWGQANYFAEMAKYSDSFAYNDPNSGLNELILAKVLAGDSYECEPDNSLKFPPEKPAAGSQLKQVRYDSVRGTTNGSKVYMTYSNDKAYPAYIITYRMNYTYAGQARPRPAPSRPPQSLPAQTPPQRVPYRPAPPRPAPPAPHPSPQQTSRSSNRNPDSCSIL